jgi:hypothetical protein
MIVFEEKFRGNKFITQFRSREWVFPIRYDWGTLDVLNKFL